MYDLTSVFFLRQSSSGSSGQVNGGEKHGIYFYRAGMAPSTPVDPQQLVVDPPRDPHL